MYNVLLNCAKTMKPFINADIVVAFCGTEIHVVKQRCAKHRISVSTPTKPDAVFAYNRYNDGRVKMQQIELREVDASE